MGQLGTPSAHLFARSYWLGRAWKAVYDMRLGQILDNDCYSEINEFAFTSSCPLFAPEIL